MGDIRKRSVWWILMSLFMCPALVGAQQDLERGSLRGIKGVLVIIEDLDEEVERMELTKEAIRTDTELALRGASIRIFESILEAMAETPAAPYLYINVNVVGRTTGVTSGSYAYSITVDLKQQVLSLVTDEKVLGSTWHRGYTGSVGGDNLRMLRNPIADQVNEFINDYLAANPKRP